MDYQRMLENREQYEAMGWPLVRATFINHLDEVRVITASDLAHWRQVVPWSTDEQVEQDLDYVRTTAGGVAQRVRSADPARPTSTGND